MSNHHVDDHWLYETGQRVNSRPGPIGRQREWITDRLKHSDGLGALRGKLADSPAIYKHDWHSRPVGDPVVRVTPTGTLLRSDSNPVPLEWRYDPAAPGSIRASMRRSA